MKMILITLLIISITFCVIDSLKSSRKQREERNRLRIVMGRRNVPDICDKEF